MGMGSGLWGRGQVLIIYFSFSHPWLPGRIARGESAADSDARSSGAFGGPGRAAVSGTVGKTGQASLCPARQAPAIGSGGCPRANNQDLTPIPPPYGTELVTGEHRGGHRQRPNAFGAVAADSVPGRARQDRCQRGHALAIRTLPDGCGGSTQAAVLGDPGADRTIATARDGAGMTARTVKTAGEGESNGENLRGSPMHPPNRAFWATS